MGADATHELLANLGYLLVPGVPFHRGTAYLLVAIRPRPTRAHFDPERISYWTVEDAHAEPADIGWPMATPNPRYAWGHIEIVDRVAATNRFVSFGGELTVSRDGSVHAALFRSAAPIMSLGGHSGPIDPLAANVSGFFATLKAAVGNDPVIRMLSDTLAPNAIYAAFLMRVIAQYRAPNAAQHMPVRLLAILRSEICRLETEASADELAGSELAARLAAL